MPLLDRVRLHGLLYRAERRAVRVADYLHARRLRLWRGNEATLMWVAVPRPLAEHILQRAADERRPANDIASELLTTAMRR